MSRPAWIVVAVLAVAHVGLSLATAARVRAPVTYVFTPLVDVVPGGAPLTGGEAAELSAEAKSRVDARDIQQAYARMGSTISLDDLLRGVEAVEASPTPLTEAQRARIRAILDGARADHAAVMAVQTEILDLEARLDGQVAEILAALPPETRTRVSARAEGGGSRGAAGGPGGGPPGKRGPPARAGGPAGSDEPTGTGARP